MVRFIVSPYGIGSPTYGGKSRQLVFFFVKFIRTIRVIVQRFVIRRCLVKIRRNDTTEQFEYTHCDMRRMLNQASSGKCERDSYHDSFISKNYNKQQQQQWHQLTSKLWNGLSRYILAMETM
jgi:hypothetical protein